ncbi:MAG TPA: NAD(P)-dependent oxidoreductase [Pseudolabrys sp.]|nr:NAD(P)-dependent oxidoreductase [Pseudolabrys sp.]HVY19779.1 NAD(P)-dependent oxidoreductase [Bauldia sp.]
MKVSFIGLGKMGLAMSDRLLGGGHTLTVYNRTATKGSDLVSRGAKLAASVAEAAKASDVVITMLENDGALASVAFDKGGLVESLGKDAIHVSMGTHSIGLIRKLTEAHAKAGQILVGAPVMGRPPAAAAGQLGILAGGPASAIEKCQPLFAVMGRRTFDAGKEPVAAASAKISVNLVLACAIEAMGEGFALAEKCGLPGPAFLEILTDGLFAAPAYKIYGKIIAEKGYFGDPGFSATTGLKDINLALAASEGVGVPTPALNVSRDRLLGAIANGHGDRDWSVMALEQARASGIE